MALLNHKSEPIGNESLENWLSVGVGGFGHVYRVWHKEWRFDVAVKILKENVRHDIHEEKAISEEANHMEKASCEFVLRLYGIYRGCPPVGGSSTRQGIVMEYMQGESVESLQKNLPGPPPWPLAFRLAYEVALGMNFLHSKGIMHHDLKASNVLLNDELHARIADFGLSKVSTPDLNSSTGIEGGSYKYKPPEAFESSYEPAHDFDYDKYSYGILLFTIVYGQEPYRDACYSRVELAMSRGERPAWEEIDQQKAEGLKELVGLMRRCWDDKPSERPSFIECVDTTKNVFSMHKPGIHTAVNEVLEKLESANSSTQSSTNEAPEQPQLNDTVDTAKYVKTEPSSRKELITISAEIMSDAEKVEFVNDKRSILIQDVSEVMGIVEELGDMVHKETYSVIKAEKTSQDKMRELYHRTLRSGGAMVEAAFYDALKNNHPQLVARLGGR